MILHQKFFEMMERTHLLNNQFHSPMCTVGLQSGGIMVIDGYLDILLTGLIIPVERGLH